MLCQGEVVAIEKEMKQKKIGCAQGVKDAGSLKRGGQKRPARKDAIEIILRWWVYIGQDLSREPDSDGKQPINGTYCS